MTKSLLWNNTEDQVLRQLYPNYSLILSALPHRDINSIKNRCSLLGIRAKRHVWTNREVGLIRDHYPNMSYDDLEAVIGQPISRIRAKANHIGIARASPPVKHSGSQLVDQLLARCHQKGVTMVALDRLAGTGRYFQNLQWRIKLAGNSRSWLSMGKVIRAIRSLGGNLGAEWGDDDADDQQAK